MFLASVLEFPVLSSCAPPLSVPDIFYVPHGTLTQTQDSNVLKGVGSSGGGKCKTYRNRIVL